MDFMQCPAWSLSDDQNTIHAEKGYAEKHNFHMAAFMVFTGHGVKARTHAHAEIAHLPRRCTAGAWEAQVHRLSAFQVLMVHLVGKCAISTWAFAVGTNNSM